jgi:dihydropteroate synthase
VSLDEELERVMPVVQALVREGVAVSVDTMKPEVMRAAAQAGCAMVNDVNGFRAPGAVEAVSASEVAVCAMHMQGTPATMQAEPRYADVVADVRGYLAERAGALEAAGVPRDRIVLDPGFGFGKTFAHNVALFAGLRQITTLGYPLLVGVSRKRMIGEITGRAVGERVSGSVAAALLAVQNGARVVRVHDVRETVDALAVLAALKP